MNSDLVVRTSQADWLARLTTAYRERRSAILIDDAALGIDPRDQTLSSMGLQAGFGFKQWKQVGACSGIGIVGVGLFAMAMIDPEPTSKLTLILVTGAFLAISGAGGAVYLLTGLKPPAVQLEGNRFSIRWD